MGAIKKYKLPDSWDSNTARIIEEMFNDLFAETQSKYFEQVTTKPDDSAGKNGEIRIDKKGNKLYVKYGDTWHEVALT